MIVSSFPSSEDSIFSPMLPKFLIMLLSQYVRISYSGDTKL